MQAGLAKYYTMNSVRQPKIASHLKIVYSIHGTLNYYYKRNTLHITMQSPHCIYYFWLLLEFGMSTSHRISNVFVVCSYRSPFVIGYSPFAALHFVPSFCWLQFFWCVINVVFFSPFKAMFNRTVRWSLLLLLYLLQCGHLHQMRISYEYSNFQKINKLDSKT